MRAIMIKSVVLLSIITATTATFLPLNIKSVNAQSDSQANCVMTPHDFIQPNSLVMMAYRGAFQKEGIPSYIVFVTEANAGKVTADGIVKAAVEGCVLSDKYGMHTNDNYIADVKSQIQVLLQSQQD